MPKHLLHVADEVHLNPSYIDDEKNQSGEHEETWAQQTKF